MASHTRSDFNQMLALSLGVHLTVLVAMHLGQAMQTKRPIIDLSTQEAMNIMWADTVRGPLNVAPDKLPGPIIPPQPPASAQPEPQKVLAPTESGKSAVAKPAPPQTERARAQAMQDALAGLQLSTPERRPTPRPENFGYVEGATETGIPGSPYGGGSGAGRFLGDPRFLAFKRSVQDIVTQNFLWLQEGSNLRAEVAFRMALNGELLDPQVVKSSGNVSFDQAGLRAIRKSSPLPLPADALIKDLSRETFVVVFEPRRQ